jgi:hypothetical protein
MLRPDARRFTAGCGDRAVVRDADEEPIRSEAMTSEAMTSEAMTSGAMTRGSATSSR